MKKRKKLGIKQFEGVRNMTRNIRDPFVNCFYTPLLSVVEYYNQSILQIVLNPLFYYEYITRIAYPTGYLRVRVDSLFSLDVILEKMGIELSGANPRPEDLLSVIKDNIENDSPVLVNIDMFYQVGRDDYYQKKHDGNHGILIYGYNDFDETIYFLDDVNGYDEYVMKYQDLFIYYKGLFEFCGASSETGATIYIFSMKDSSFISDNQEESLAQIKRFSLAMIENKQKVIRGREDLLNFMEIQRSVINNQEIISALNSTFQRKQSEQFQYIFLEKYGFYNLDNKCKVQSSLSIIVRNWIKIRNIIAKNVYKNSIYSNQTQNVIISLIKEIYVNEEIFHSNLFEILEKWVYD